MPRQPRDLQPNYCYHVTTRCNNREFKLLRHECREVFIYALNKAINKFKFKLYALCIMSNHVHYLIEPKQPEDLHKIMQYINWYTAICFNRMLNRTGHFWEQRYFSGGFPKDDYQRALNTLRYIHANPVGFIQKIFGGRNYQRSEIAITDLEVENQSILSNVVEIDYRYGGSSTESYLASIEKQEKLDSMLSQSAIN